MRPGTEERTVELPFLQNLIFDLSLMYAFSAEENSRQVVQPLAMMYSTWLEISVSESGGRNEKVSNTLQKLLYGTDAYITHVSVRVEHSKMPLSEDAYKMDFTCTAAQVRCGRSEGTSTRHLNLWTFHSRPMAGWSVYVRFEEGCAAKAVCNQQYDRHTDRQAQACGTDNSQF
jgi:hypothetical protein